MCIVLSITFTDSDERQKFNVALQTSTELTRNPVFHSANHFPCHLKYLVQPEVCEGIPFCDHLDLPRLINKVDDTPWNEIKQKPFTRQTVKRHLDLFKSFSKF